MQDGSGSGTDEADGYKMPRGITAVGVFLFFGAAMASIAGTTLTWPGTFLDRLWVLNPTAHNQLSIFAKPAGVIFLLLAAVLVMAGTGWFKHRLWAWKLTVAVIATQFLGDLINFFRGDYLRGSVGISVATALLLYLLRPVVRAVFNRAVLP